MEGGSSNLDVFAATLLEAAKADRDVLVVTSDSRGSGRLAPFAAAVPEQIVEVGIAEQNLIGISAGLAAAGKKVFAVSPACFLTARALEQIKNDVCYSDRPVKVVGISAGVSYGALGSTHHSLHDFAVLRAIHNTTIVAPADNFETRHAVQAALRFDKPIYLRFGKKVMPHLARADAGFELGRASLIREGGDLAFLASGETVAPALDAANLLAAEGIDCRVLSFHTIKPLDEAAVLQAAAETGCLISVEEHSVSGGLGEACASLLLQRGRSVRFKIVGFPDEYTMTGSQMELFQHYGISGSGLAATARRLRTNQSE
ncbi:MAG TPA: transketolase C-terminal domain-containing protein [Chthoniobacterales bacterium]|nr:transketolase C-terminal domain-containing protein [Chthoniobacterales bacterium]